MNSLLMAVLAGSGAPLPALSVDQQSQIGCVATLAIVASEQANGRDDGWPPLRDKGATFAQVTGERVMKDTGWSKEQVRDAIIAAVAQRQKSATANGARLELPEDEVRRCIAMMNANAPAPAPPPTLPQCAAMVAIAYDAVRAGDDAGSQARDLKTIASVLDYRAREALRAEGRSGNEIDRAMIEAREAVAAEAKRRDDNGVSAGLDYSACAEMARP